MATSPLPASDVRDHTASAATSWRLPADMDSPTVPAAALAEIGWHQSRRVRNAYHGQAGSPWCATHSAPYGRNDPRGDRIAERCRLDGCLDVHHDVIAGSELRLRNRQRQNTLGEIESLDRYIASVVGSEVADLERHIRVLRGFPAKPTRVDGAAARVLSALAHIAPDEVTLDWHHTLFRIMRSYPCRLQSRGTEWPLDGITAEKSKADGRHREIGSDEARVEVRADIQRVLDIARDTVGFQWVDDNILRPLFAGGTGPTPDPVEAADNAEPNGLETSLMAGWLRDRYLDHRGQGATREAAILLASAAVVGGPAPEITPMLLRLLKEIEEQPLRTGGPLRRCA